MIKRHQFGSAVFIACLIFVRASSARAQEGPIGVELPDEETPSEAPPDDDASSEPPPAEDTPPEPDPAPDETPAPPPDGDAPSTADDGPTGVVLPPEETSPPEELPTAKTQEPPSPRPGPTTAPAAPNPEPRTETPTPAAAPTAPEADTGAIEPAPQPPTQAAGPPQEEEEREIFSWYTVSPQIGYLFFPKSEMEFNGLKATVDPRNGITFKLHFDLGGDDLAFEIAPLYAMEFGGIRPNASGFGNLSALDFSKGVYGANFQAVGGETTIVFRFDVNRFFPHLGAGFRGTYLFGDQIQYGTEIYGRFPIGFSAYMGKHVAFVFEVGLMVGATGVRTPPSLPEAFDTMPDDLRAGLEDAKTQADFENWYLQNQAEIDRWLLDNQDNLPENYSRDQMAADFVDEQLSKTIRFGSGFGMDITIGLRFP